MSKQYCPDCGAEVATGSRFCASCGVRITEVSRRPDEADGEPTVEGGGDDATLAAITHVLALFTWVIGPLIVLLIADDEFVDENARNAINWQLMYTVYMLISFILLLIVLGFLFLAVIPLLNLIFCVIAAVKAYEGEAWRYPATPSIV